MSKKKFPERLYVAYANEGTKDEFLTCADSFSELAEKGETVNAAVYELTEVGKVTASPGYQKLRVVK